MSGERRDVDLPKACTCPYLFILPDAKHYQYSCMCFLRRKSHRKFHCFICAWAIFLNSEYEILAPIVSEGVEDIFVNLVLRQWANKALVNNMLVFYLTIQKFTNWRTARIRFSGGILGSLDLRYNFSRSKSESLLQSQGSSDLWS